MFKNPGTCVFQQPTNKTAAPEASRKAFEIRDTIQYNTISPISPPTPPHPPPPTPCWGGHGVGWGMGWGGGGYWGYCIVLYCIANSSNLPRNQNLRITPSDPSRRDSMTKIRLTIQIQFCLCKSVKNIDTIQRAVNPAHQRVERFGSFVCSFGRSDFGLKLNLTSKRTESASVCSPGQVQGQNHCNHNDRKMHV